MWRRGSADVSAIDCVSYEIFRHIRPETVGATRVIGRTARAPGPPYVTRLDVSPGVRARLQAGLVRAFADPALAEVRAQLMITGFDILPVEGYRCMTDVADDAKRRGYIELD